MFLARVALVDHTRNLSSVAMMTRRDTALESKSICRCGMIMPVFWSFHSFAFVKNKIQRTFIAVLVVLTLYVSSALPAQAPSYFVISY